MTPRFQADADFNHKIVLALRRREPAIDFVDAQHSGVIGASDSDVLQVSADSGRILVSHDRKTMPAHFARFVQARSSPGLIVVQQNLEIGSAVEDLLLIWAATDAEEWRDQIRFPPPLNSGAGFLRAPDLDHGDQ
jgi:Domain of unknown function (DUF5615)